MDRSSGLYECDFFFKSWEMDYGVKREEKILVLYYVLKWISKRWKIKEYCWDWIGMRKKKDRWRRIKVVKKKIYKRYLEKGRK